ncbi:MAG: hypothetical protein LBD87_00280 [Prevotellaceae bacterium]|jgi:hypothetical protein|nr:hypothetical protein [Prevotellaceae bacterium]
MNNSNFLPRKDVEFLQWATNFLVVLLKILSRIGFPDSVYGILNERVDIFSNKLRIADAPETRTKATVQEKNEARKSLESYLRQAIGEYLTRNHLVTDADRDNLGLPIRKTTHTPAPVATTIPWVQVVINLIRHLRFDFGGSEGSKAKPAGQHGMELAARIGDEKPANVHELTHSYFDTHTPLTIDFEEEDRGKTFWYAVRWENTRGEKGPWSEIQSAKIP